MSVRYPTVVLLLVLAAWMGSVPASAKDMDGRLGVGGEASFFSDELSTGGLLFRYWVSRLGFQFASHLQSTDVRTQITDPDDPSRTTFKSENRTTLALTIRALYNLAMTRDTNLYAGLGAALHFIDNEQQFLEALLGVEHYFTDYFSVGGHVAFQVSLGNDTDLKLGNATSWGSTFVFYF